MVDNSLVLPNVGRQDSGEYICSATNNMGTTEVTITLDVESECCDFTPAKKRSQCEEKFLLYIYFILQYLTLEKTCKCSKLFFSSL